MDGNIPDVKEGRDQGKYSEHPRPQIFLGVDYRITPACVYSSTHL